MIRSFLLAGLTLAVASFANSFTTPTMMTAITYNRAMAQEAPHEIWRIKGYVVLDDRIKARHTNGHFAFIDKESCDAFLEMKPQHPAFIQDTAALALSVVNTYGAEVRLGFVCEIQKPPGQEI